MKRSTRWLATLTAGAVLVGSPLAAFATGGKRDGKRHGGSDSRVCQGGKQFGKGGSLKVMAVTQDGRLICFNDNRPGKSRTIGTISGLQTDTALLGIDYRVANNGLYGLGDKGGVYKVDDTTGAATLASRITVALDGTSAGVDFNPVADRMRVTTSNGQNLRVNVDTGETTVDTALSYPGTPGTPLGVTGAAYTNNDADPDTGTTLFDIDTLQDQIVLQSPPDNGLLVPTGKLKKGTDATIGFDIYSRIKGGTTVSIHPRAALTAGGKSKWYDLNLFPGRAILKGSFSSKDVVTGVAIPLDQG